MAPLGSKLVLDDVSVRVDGIEWTHDLKAPLPPGTTVFGVVRVTLTNTSGVDQTVAPTQIWLLDSKNHAFVASAAAADEVDHPLVGMSIAPGKSATGTLVYPAPGRQTGNLLVYRFADATDIARATHVGLVALRLRPGASASSRLSSALRRATGGLYGRRLRFTCGLAVAEVAAGVESPP